MSDLNFTNGLLRSYQCSYEGPFTDLDSEDNFNKIKNNQPLDWEYHNKKIYYKYNRYGHRSVEISELQEDYLLFTGCSFTEGVSLAVEDIYCSLISKALDKSFYNLAVGGSSPAITVKNLIGFLSQIEIFPSAIIIQWPYFQRYYTVSDGLYIEHYTPACEPSQLYRAMLIDDNAFRYNIIERNFLLDFITNIGYNGKIVEMFIGQSDDELEIICKSEGLQFQTEKLRTIDPIDFGRDLGHPGAKTHRLYADKILELLLEKI